MVKEEVALNACTSCINDEEACAFEVDAERRRKYVWLSWLMVAIRYWQPINLMH